MELHALCGTVGSMRPGNFLIVALLALTAASCKQRRTRDGSKVEGVYSIGPEFVWPEKLQKQDLPQATNEYATRVGTCLNVWFPDRGQAEYISCRTETKAAVLNAHYRLDASDDPAALKENRDRLCEVVRENFVEKKYGGGKCSQYGNCGEGGWVNYCLAHTAGYTDIKQCESANDHVFAMLRDGDQICVMDRWNLEESIGYFRCSENIAVQNGTLVLPDKSLSQRKWYNGVTCIDPLSRGDRSRDTVSAQQWGLEVKGTCHCQLNCVYKAIDPGFFSTNETTNLIQYRLSDLSVPECEMMRLVKSNIGECKKFTPKGFNYDTVNFGNCILEPESLKPNPDH